MAPRKTILVYFTQSSSHEAQAALVHDFNHPQGRVDQESQNRFDLANVNALGLPVEDAVALHAQKHDMADLADAAQIHRSLIVVADDGVSPSSHPQTVLIVKILEGAEGKNVGSGASNRYQPVRVLASNVASVLATIANGEHGWEDYWSVAQANGGHFPGE
ncbi:hypothetical protein FPV67DRAFT_1503099 [Lyophyllum atratum]|nr:hypothetical protein FPV67DRAFT_1503099 [Lyophyllum atratum]